jgi:hypothetical protein
MYTLTTRKSSPDRLELRYAETDNQISLVKTPLGPFLGIWLETTEIIEYGNTGSYQIQISRVDTDEVLMSYSNSLIVNWRPEASFVRPKWGIYRSLLNVQDLRDETVLFADFSVEEIEVTSTEKSLSNNSPAIFTNPAHGTINIRNLGKEIDLIRLCSLNGKKVVEQDVQDETSIELDVSLHPTGIYILHFSGKNINESRLVMVD